MIQRALHPLRRRGTALLPSLPITAAANSLPTTTPTAATRSYNATTAAPPPSSSSHAASYRPHWKDRTPPPLCDLSDPRRRLAVLIDGRLPPPHFVLPQTGPTAEEGGSSNPSLCDIGVPVLWRVFSAAPLPALWAPHCHRWDEAAPPSSSASSVTPSLQWFPVESFIPHEMQMVADAQHLMRWRVQNEVQGVVYVVPSAAVAEWKERLSSSHHGQSLLNQYLVDDSGSVVASFTVDSR